MNRSTNNDFDLPSPPEASAPVDIAPSNIAPLDIAPLDIIVQEFLAEVRDGRQPDIEAYCQRHIELADELRPVLLAAWQLEIAKPDSASVCEPNNSPRPLPWKRLGDYRLVREAGRGGMGVVYEAIQESLSRRVALKTLPSHTVMSNTQLERFQREARAVAMLHHTNIVPVFAVGQESGVYYYVMPFINGTGLERVLAELRSLPRRDSKTSQPPENAASTEQMDNDSDRQQHTGDPSRPIAVANDLSNAWEQLSQGVSDLTPRSISSISSSERAGYWDRVAGIGLQVADALEYAAGQGVLHRDIKPSNLLLDSDGIVWVTDFGLAKMAECDDLTRTGELLGTLRYLAPERMRGIHDVRGDIYGLGLTLYELVTLQFPFASRQKGELIRQIMEADPPRPRSIDPRIPGDLETIIRKAIAKDPRDRYQTPASMADDLRLFLGDRPIKARRTSYAEQGYRWCRRNPTIAGLVACVMVLLALTTGVLAMTNARIRRETAEKTAALQSAYVAMGEREAALKQRAASEELASSRFYAAHVNLAGQAYQRAETTRAEDLIQSVIPLAGTTDFRGFEWRFLHDALQRGLLHTSHHSGGEVLCTAFSPNGESYAVTGGSRYSGFWSVHDAATGSVHMEHPNHTTSVNACDFSPDGSMLAIAFGNGTLQLFDTSTWQEVHAEKLGVYPRRMVWAPDGTSLVLGAAGGELLFLSFPEYEQTLIAKAHSAELLQLFYSYDGQSLYSAVDWGAEGMITRKWDLSVWPPVEKKAYPGRYLTDDSPDGKTLVGVNSGEVFCVDAESGDLLHESTVAVGPMVGATYAADGASLYVAARSDRLIRKVDSSTLEILSSYAQNNTLSTLSLDPRGRYWAAGDSRGDVRVWKTESKGVEFEVQADTDCHIFFVAGKKDPIIASPKASLTWSLDDKLIPWHDARGVRAISADGKTLAAISQESKQHVEVWRSGQAQPLRIKFPYEIYHNCIALSSSGRYLALGGGTTQISIYDVRAQPQEIHVLKGYCSQLVFSPDEKVLVGGEQFGSVCVFDVNSGERLSNIAEFDSWWAWALGIAFSHDGRYVAAGNESGKVRVWEMDTRKLVATLKGQPGEIRVVAFFPDSRRLASGGVTDVRIWDYQSGQELLSLPTNDRVQSLAINDAGDTVVVALDKGNIKAWVGHATP